MSAISSARYKVDRQSKGMGPAVDEKQSQPQSCLTIGGGAVVEEGKSETRPKEKRAKNDIKLLSCLENEEK